MKILLNENIPLQAAEALRNRGHDILWARTGLPGSSDAEILERAATDGRILVTFDKDFGELVYHAGRTASAGVILFRIPQPSAATVAEQMVAALESRNDWHGKFSVVEPGRVRMVPLTEQKKG